MEVKDILAEQLARLSTKPSSTNTNVHPATIPSDLCPLGECDGKGEIYDGIHQFPLRCNCVSRYDMLDAAGIPLRYKSARLADVRNVLARKFAECASVGKDPCALVLQGPVGTGKSHMGYSVLHHMIVYRGIRGKAERVPDLLQSIRLDKYGNRELDALQEVSALMLDDLGAHRETEFVLERLFTIIDARYANMRPTIITMNGGFKDYLEQSDTVQAWQRLFSRLRQMAQDKYVIEMTGKDKRLAVKA